MAAVNNIPRLPGRHHNVLVDPGGTRGRDQEGARPITNDELEGENNTKCSIIRLNDAMVDGPRWSSGGQRCKIDAVDAVYACKLRATQRAKVRSIKQGIEESTLEYYYDMLDLSRKVDARMVEATELAYLWQGLRPSVLEKLWSLKLTNCDEFLQEVKRFQEMTD
ncbi:hypothetical protein OUZ56_006079 [Daphnia magna]|uniref:Retrotransposon gag domain-containing protein n=1 Tax=Daphnia magna TaxID=35525 RepID=A0ABQ9YUK8_9CRUS|nr:hypothetical protein OUZ56_006079 [Daphnia magna]